MTNVPVSSDRILNTILLETNLIEASLGSIRHLWKFVKKCEMSQYYNESENGRQRQYRLFPVNKSNEIETIYSLH